MRRSLLQPMSLPSAIAPGGRGSPAGVNATNRDLQLDIIYLMGQEPLSHLIPSAVALLAAVWPERPVGANNHSPVEPAHVENDVATGHGPRATPAVRNPGRLLRASLTDWSRTPVGWLRRCSSSIQHHPRPTLSPLSPLQGALDETPFDTPTAQSFPDVAVGSHDAVDAQMHIGMTVVDTETALEVASRRP